MPNQGGGIVTDAMEATDVGGIELMLKESRSLDFPVFDADNHLYETPQALTKFLPQQYEGIVKYVDVGGRTKLAVDEHISNFIPNPTFGKVAPPGGQENDPHQRRYLASPDAFFEPAARLQLMRSLGLERALMFPTLAGTVEEAMKHDILAYHAIAHAFNEWMHEEWSFNYEDAIVAVPIVPLSILDEAIKELEWVLERGAKTFWLRAGWVNTYRGPRSFALEEFDPFWKIVEDADVLVSMHAGDVGYNQFLNSWEGFAGLEMRPFQSLGSPAFRAMANNPLSAVDSCASIIGHGLASRFPKLKFAPIEFRPFASEFVERIAEAYEATPVIFDEDPVEVFRRNIFVHAFQDRHPQALVDLIGVDNVMFGSDFPHVEGLNDPLAYVDFLSDMSEEDQAKIMGGNLARLLNIEM